MKLALVALGLVLTSCMLYLFHGSIWDKQPESKVNDSSQPRKKYSTIVNVVLVLSIIAIVLWRMLS